jgi:uncharacterized protein (TIGR02452 family)
MPILLPCLDSNDRAARCRDLLSIDRDRAALLGRSAVAAADQGRYRTGDGGSVDWSAAVEHARAAKLSIPPDAILPPRPATAGAQTRVQVANETTLEAARRLVDQGLRVLALNFANGLHPGGGFLTGARAQEQVLCRSSALFATLDGDPMYQAHARRRLPDASDWAILSPDVPVFRTEDGTALDEPWTLGILTCAAPYALGVGLERSADLLAARIRRVLAIAAAHGYDGLVLGAWGCGAFHNDPARTARDFHAALTERDGAFSDVVFAIADWSPERRFLGPFRRVLSAD